MRHPLAEVNVPIIRWCRNCGSPALVYFDRRTLDRLGPATWVDFSFSQRSICRTVIHVTVLGDRFCDMCRVNVDKKEVCTDKTCHDGFCIIYLLPDTGAPTEAGDSWFQVAWTGLSWFRVTIWRFKRLVKRILVVLMYFFRVRPGLGFEMMRFSAYFNYLTRDIGLGNHQNRCTYNGFRSYSLVIHLLPLTWKSCGSGCRSQGRSR